MKKTTIIFGGRRIITVVFLTIFLIAFGVSGCTMVKDFSDYISGNDEQLPDDANIIDEPSADFTEVNEPDDNIPVVVEPSGDDSSLRTTRLLEPAQSQIGVFTDVTQVVEEVMPSVVSVSRSFTTTFNYFGRQFDDTGESSGSGIIVGENETELLIATNYHVVQEATSLMIQFFDDTIVEAQLKGSRPNMDLAVVAVNLADLGKETLDSIAIAALGDSDTLRVGEPAIAIGNALGYGQSVTVGVISALERETSYFVGDRFTDVYQIEGRFIQTDAAINPGNSGGALLNIRGEVIGINTSKMGGSIIEGMGYAIPISAAKPIIAELMVRETRLRVDADERGFIGITGTTVNLEASELYGLPKGAYITGVYDNTPAAAAGIVEGDIITHFDGIEINSWEELLGRVAFYRAGDEVEIALISGDAINGYSEKTVRLTLAGRPSSN
ncbi:MAG: trypsin-like peptidase domain-containing protein [Lachnospiraceae bacterium]|jgi:serine protease Do|nr:trypsin-like peptidase domain-containing protein [Lachnospiraceae bacterium]